MYRIVKFLFAVSAASFLAFSCEKEKVSEPVWMDVTPNNIAGTWELAEWWGAPLAEGSFVYMELIRRDNKFVMYQNIDSYATRKFSGIYSIDESSDVISGRYDNEVGNWNNDYVISELTADRMVWTVKGNPDDVSVYVRCEIPEDVLKSVADVKSAEVQEVPSIL